MNIHMKALVRTIRFTVIWFGTIYGLEYLCSLYFEKETTENIITIVESAMITAVSIHTAYSIKKLRARSLHFRYSNYINESVLVMAYTDTLNDKKLLLRVNDIKLNGLKDLNKHCPYPDQNKFNEVVECWESFDLSQPLFNKDNFIKLIKLIDDKEN